MTIKDIAKECGYGVGTVSRALNNHPGISDKARQKIYSVVDKYGFVLNQNAKKLKEHAPRTIAVLVQGAQSILFNSLLEIIQNKLQNLPYNASVFVLNEYDNGTQAACKIYYEQKPAGIIFLGGNPDSGKEEFDAIKVPCVLIANSPEDKEGTQTKNLSSVSTDDETASYFCTEYLIKKGHKKICVIGGELQSSCLSRRRFNGFLCAMNDYGLPFNKESMYIPSMYSLQGGFDAASTLIKKCPDASAVFTMSDVMAMGACRSFADMGISIPKDISITGFDGLSVASYSCPRITTIRQDCTSLANEGLSSLLNSIEHGRKPSHKFVPFQFIEGESVKSLK